MTQAVVLAGGKGTRLASRLNGRPKPLVDVDGVPLLERQLRALAGRGVDDVVLLVNHAADQIAAFLAERGPGLRVRLIDDGAPRGTAGAVLACLPELAERFFVVYGDTLFDLDLAHLDAAHAQHGAEATLLVHPNDHPADSDLVELDPDGRITAFHPYPHPPGAELQNLVNAAFYLVERRALEPWREASPPLDFAKDLFPAMLAKGARLYGHVTYEYIKDLGTPARLDKAERHLRTGVVARAARSAPQAAVFLDRDGTLNRLRDYVRRPEELELLEGAARAVRRFNDAELRTVLVTNQPVIARGEVTSEGLARIHARLSSQLGAQGAYLDALYHCPHHPDAGFAGEVAALKVRCDCRKPGPGLFRRAIEELNLAVERSWMVGDASADMAAAESVGLASVLVRTGEGGRDGKHPMDPDFVVDDVAQAAELVTATYPRLAALLTPQLEALEAGTLVLVGGPARSGKSTLAAVIRRELRRRDLACERLPLDRWIRPADARGEGVLGRFDLDAAREALGPWLAGSEARFTAPEYDRRTRTRRPGPQVVLPADAVLVLEGVPALMTPWPTRRPVLRLHVEGDPELRRRRVVDDLVARGLADAGEALRVQADRERDEVAPVQAAGARADFVIRPDAAEAAA